MNDHHTARRQAIVEAAALDVPTVSAVVEPLEGRPEVPTKVRDVAYFATLGTAAASALGAGISAIWFPEIASQVAATGGVLTTVMGIIGGGLGVIYRPGAQS